MDTIPRIIETLPLFGGSVVILVLFFYFRSMQEIKSITKEIFDYVKKKHEETNTTISNEIKDRHSTDEKLNYKICSLRDDLNGAMSKRELACVQNQRENSEKFASKDEVKEIKEEMKLMSKLLTEIKEAIIRLTNDNKS